MKLDEFQTRLRAIYDGTLARSAEAERDDAPSADEIGPVVNAETVRFAEAVRAARAGG